MIRRLFLVGMGILSCLLLGYQALAAPLPASRSTTRSSDGGTLIPTATLTPTVIPTIVPISLSSYLPLVVKAPPPPTATPTPIPTHTPLPTPTAVPPTAIPPTPTLITVNPTCSGVANTAAPNLPIAIKNVNKAGNPETVTLRNQSTQTVDLTDWWICSMNGNQRHAILSGTIAPGQSLVIVSQAGGPIWNNTTTDPAVLFRRDGFQVSYRSQ